MSLIDDVSCEDEQFEQELCETLDDVCSEPKDQLKCLHCSKLYKTKRGLTRHLEDKHPSGNMDKFHSQFHKFSLPSTHLCSEVSCLCLGKLVSGSEIEKKEDIKKELSEKEKNCIQYLAGYCFWTIYSRLRKKKPTLSIEQMLSILHTVKIENDQILVDTRNRGGLWKVNERAQDIFIHKIDSELLTSELIKKSICKM